MEGAYLPGNIRQRMQELMKEHADAGAYEGT